MKIFLTKRVEQNYISIKIYVAKEWLQNVAAAFEEKAFDFLTLLMLFPEMGSEEVAEKQIRAFQLTKQTKVFYRIKNESIIILSFFDVRQNPIKKPK